MGRKSILTDDQWVEVAKRQLAGESVRALSREFGVSEAAIRGYLARRGQSNTVREVAHMINEAQDVTQAAEVALRALPLPEQAAAINLAGKLRSISEAAADVANISARTALRFASLANSEASKIDDAEPMKSVENLKAAVLLQKAANEAMVPASNLLAANRDAIKRLNEEAPPEEDEDLTPERLQEGARRLAFVLHRAAASTETH